MPWGEKLKKRREELGCTLQTAEEETKIRKLYLQALENDDFAVLPPRIYAIGFVKNYARFLGLDEEILVRQFKELAYGNGTADEDSDGAANLPKPAVLTSLPPWLNMKNMAAAVVFLLLAVWVGQYLVNYMAGQRIVEQPPIKPPIAEKQEPSGGEVTEAPDEEINVAPRENVNLAISARQECWLEVSIDGVSDYMGLMQAGEEKTFIGQESIYIKAGNAGGIEIIVNGENQGMFGEIGQVKRQEFTL